MSSLSNRRITHIVSKHTGYFQNFHHNLIKASARYNCKMHYLSNRHFASKPNDVSPSSPLPHHYSTLNIDENAPIDDIKKAYNNLIKQWHPDLYVSQPISQQQEAQKKFLLIRDAYETIINHKDNTKKTSLSEKLLHKQASKFKAAKRTAANAKYSYYSWGKKVYETQQNSETDQENEQNEDAETEEMKYSEYYKQNKTWIGKTTEELYDWLIFLYMRNPSWMQFFLITTACFGLVQSVWHFIYPSLNDSDPDRIWNVFKSTEKHQGSGYQPSSTAAMQTTPSLVALQPHFKGYTSYGAVDGDNKYKGHSNEDFTAFKEDSALKMFTKLNLNSTVNRDLFRVTKKKKRHDTADMVTVENDESEVLVEVENVKVKLKRPVLDYNDIPLELRSSPMGVLLASHAVDSGDLQRSDGNGYDWSSVIKKYRKLNEQNDNERLQAQ